MFSECTDCGRPMPDGYGGLCEECIERATTKRRTFSEYIDAIIAAAPIPTGMKTPTHAELDALALAAGGPRPVNRRQRRAALARARRTR